MLGFGTFSGRRFGTFSVGPRNTGANALVHQPFTESTHHIEGLACRGRRVHTPL